MPNKFDRLLRALLEGATSSVVPEPRIQQLERAIDAPRLNPLPFEPQVRGFLAGATGASVRQTTPVDLALMLTPARGGGHSIRAAMRSVLGRRRAAQVADVDPAILEALDARITGLPPGATALSFKDQQYQRGLRREFRR